MLYPYGQDARARVFLMQAFEDGLEPLERLVSKWLTTSVLCSAALAGLKGEPQDLPRVPYKRRPQQSSMTSHVVRTNKGGPHLARRQLLGNDGV